MSWLSGSCYLPADGVGAAFISTDAYPEPVRIDDADVRADEAERERVELDGHAEREPVQAHRSDLDRLLVRIAETHPGIVVKLRVLWGDVEAEVVPRRAMVDLARVLRIMAGGLEVQADAPLSTLEPSSSE